MMTGRPVVRRKLLAALLGSLSTAAVLLNPPGGAIAAERLQQAAIDGTQQADVATLEKFLNGIRTVRSAFVQTASNGNIAEGTLYLSRPDKLRIDYNPPAKLQIFGGSTWLIFVDEELKEVNQLPISATPAALLLQDKISLSNDVKVLKITREGGIIRLHLVQADEPDAGRLIVAIAASPLSLRGWTVIDAQGVETTVTLIGPAINEKIADKEFIYSPPFWMNPEPD